MVGPEARLREGLFTPLSHCFMGEGWGEGAGEPAKIATVPDSPSAPVRLCIWQRPETHTLTLSLVRERASMSSSLRNSMRAIFALQTVFRQSSVVGEGIQRQTPSIARTANFAVPSPSLGRRDRAHGADFIARKSGCAHHRLYSRTVLSQVIFLITARHSHFMCSW